MLSEANVQPMLPVKDMKGAQRFYEETLGLKKVGGEADTALVYRSGGTTLCVYRSEYAGTNEGTAAVWEVEDVDGTVNELKAKGVEFEHYDLPGMTRRGDVHRADGFGVAWFKDPAGNILSVQTKEMGQKR